MKYTIRPLKWVETQFCIGTGVFYSKDSYWLQVRHANLVDKPFIWRIQRGTRVIDSGDAQTLEDGKLHCEKAWQDYLLKNFLEIAL